VIDTIRHGWQVHEAVDYRVMDGRLAVVDIFIFIVGGTFTLI
jgi:hypothetical protein